MRGAKEKLNLDVDTLTVTLVEVLRRYTNDVVEEKDIEDDIQMPENIDQFYLINNYTNEIPNILKAVSSRNILWLRLYSNKIDLCKIII